MIPNTRKKDKLLLICKGLGLHFFYRCKKICFLKISFNVTAWQGIHDRFFTPTTKGKIGEYEFIFQYEFATPYTTKSTKEWFSEKRTPVFDWPSNSPDANVLENLSGILKGN